ncbi:hypothetical protein [Streptomyces sp. NPDC050560]|uniref:hypothetical protein n=1 Tax=Streptomyces sp. NPDC050560 TaxID=3365630 RepID=UPI0037B0D839
MSQTRAMVRRESVLIAAFGTAGGLARGTFLGWALVRVPDGASDSGFAFALPPVRLLAVLLVGLPAALRPARRAARHPVLASLAVE